MLVVNSISHYVKICFYNLLFNSDFIKCYFPGRYTICVFICTIVRWGMLVAGSRLTSPDLCEEQIFFYSHDVYMCSYTSFFKKIFLNVRVGVLQWSCDLLWYNIIKHWLIFTILATPWAVIRQPLTLLVFFSALVFCGCISCVSCLGAFQIYILGHFILSISTLFWIYPQ